MLRAPADKDAPNEDTTGITLRQLVDKWLVIPPQVVETVLPKQQVIRFAQLDGSITIVLRAPADKDAPNEETMGITLRQLVDKWAVIPPQVVETTLPKQAK